VDRETVRNAGLALLGVVAVALTATTLPTARQSEPRGSGGTGAPGDGSGSGLAPRPTDPLPQLLDVPFLTELVTLLVVLAALVALWVLFVHRRRAFRIAVLTLAVGIVGAVIVQFVPMGAPPAPPSNVSAPMGNASGGGGETTGTASGPSLVSLVLVVVLGGALAGVAVAARRRSGDDEDGDGADDRETDAGVAAVGRAAGRAADRIESSADVENEVFRAWREMTDHLDVARPETQTAREFEQAAIAAGMTAEDVGELTDLFERARYDDYAVDATDEERAVDLLRRIEDRYVEGER